MYIKQTITHSSVGVSILLALGLALPSMADASVLDSFANLFTAKVAYVAGDDYTSQNIPILCPVRNSNPQAIGGGDIVVRDGTVLVAEAGPEGSAVEFTEGQRTGGQVSIYIVRKGDTLGEIAEKFGVSINTIRWANDIKHGSTIRPGQQLVILPITGIKYTIKRGGTLRDVVKKYGGDLDEAAKFNGVGPDEELAKGTVVMIPNGEYASPKPTRHYIARKRTWVTSRPRHVSHNYLPGYFVHPLNHAGVKTQGIHGYNAIDFGAPVGTPIIASASGKVILARKYGYNGGYGLYTIIQHPNGVQTVYAHMSKNISYVGEHVVQGQVIGYVGNTGRSTGPHLHFEVRGAKNPF